MIYLDSAATTLPSEVVKRDIQDYIDRGGWLNADSKYSAARKAKEVVEYARSQVLRALHANPDEYEVIFTSGGAEANSLVLADKTIASSIEHSSILNSPEVDSSTLIPVDKGGEIQYDALEHHIHSKFNYDKRLISVMYMNNEVGTINDIKKVIEICHDYGFPVHSDCVQAFGVCDVNVDELDIDAVSISGHKIHGMQGTGALCIRRSLMENFLFPIIYASPSQEFGMRGGTKNVLGIQTLGTACRVLNWKEESKCCNYLRNLMIKQVFDNMPNANDILIINGKDNPKILNLTIKGCDAETMVMMLSNYGICISAGSACHEQENEPSHVLTAMGISPELARQSIRLSFSSELSSDEVLRTGQKIIQCANVLLGGNLL